MSAEWSVQSLQSSLAKKDLYPLYYFFGDETFLIDEALVQLQEVALADGLRDFNLNTYYGDHVDASVIRDAIETLPMMAQVRLVVVKEAHDLSEKDWENLLPVLESPVESTIFVCIGNRIDRRKKYIKKFIERGVVVEFKRPFENQIPDWIVSISKRYGLKLDTEVVALVHQLVGSNLVDINGELLKISQYIGTRKAVTTDDVLQVVSRVRIDSVFDLTEAIGNNDRAKALLCLANLLDHGQNEFGVLSLVGRHLRILKTVKDGIRDGLAGARLSSRAGVSQYFLRQYTDQSRFWSERKIETAFQALLDTDRALKSSPIASHIWLENFILKTCNSHVSN